MGGVLKRNNSIRVLRENVVIFEGALVTPRRFKDDVSEVKANTGCGLKIRDCKDARISDKSEGSGRIDFSIRE